MIKIRAPTKWAIGSSTPLICHTPQSSIIMMINTGIMQILEMVILFGKFTRCSSLYFLFSWQLLKAAFMYRKDEKAIFIDDLPRLFLRVINGDVLDDGICLIVDFFTINVYFYICGA